MCSEFKNLIFLLCFSFAASYHEKYRVPHTCSEKMESYLMNDREYILQNMPVTWENAKILCRGRYNASLAAFDTKQKAEFFAEALSESQLSVEAVWVGARRDGPDDPLGYRWGNNIELRRTALDVITDNEKDAAVHYPLWLNRTRVPVPEAGADCVALERIFHDRPVFVDMPCLVERPFVCEKEASKEVAVTEMKTVRCRSGLYRLYDGSMNWHQAAAYCVMHKMTLANIGSMRCLKKLGMLMLKTRPSMENAWIGARGEAGRWWWTDTGASIFETPVLTDVTGEVWPPLRDRSSLKSEGCMQLDRHSTHAPVFLESRCERKMQFICYEGRSAKMLFVSYEAAPQLRAITTPPGDDTYFYILVRKLLPWTEAYENCLKMKGTLGSLDTNDLLIQLLLVMGENREAPVANIWVSGYLNSTRDPATDAVTYSWYNPATKKKIPDLKSDLASSGFIPPWLDEEPAMDSPCLNLDRQDHLKGLVYGLPCHVPQYSICMIDRHQPMSTQPAETTTPVSWYSVTPREQAPVRRVPTTKQTTAVATEAVDLDKLAVIKNASTPPAHVELNSTINSI